MVHALMHISWIFRFSYVQIFNLQWIPFLFIHVVFLYWLVLTILFKSYFTAQKLFVFNIVMIRYIIFQSFYHCKKLQDKKTETYYQITWCYQLIHKMSSFDPQNVISWFHNVISCHRWITSCYQLITWWYELITWCIRWYQVMILVDNILSINW
jgi:hypothetical protein